MKLILFFSLGASECYQRFWNHSIQGFEDVNRKGIDGPFSSEEIERTDGALVRTVKLRVP